MFTGIVERRATAVEIRTTTGGKHLGFRVEEGDHLPAWTCADVGESIAVSGVCLTVVVAEGPRIAFDAVPETLALTSLGMLAVGDAVNIERSLRVGDRFGGHYVTGHVDGTGQILDLTREGDQVLFRLRPEECLLRQMLTKGSIAVDGVSLTLVEVARQESWFSFAAIPHTLDVTTLGRTAAGDTANLETDAFGKWVVHTLREGEVDTPALP